MHATMKAVVTTGQGGYERLHYTDVPMPVLSDGEVLLRVLAAGINNTDINTRVGWYGAPPGPSSDSSASPSNGFGQAQVGWNGATPFPLIQGADCCGEVVAMAAGDAVPDSEPTVPAGKLSVGQRVLVRSCMRSHGFGSTETVWLGTDFDGAFAQYVRVPATEVFAIDSDWSDAALATLPCAYGTAENMLHRAAVHAQDHVLVTGASGGVGSAAIQLALRRGAQVTAITSADKRDAVLALGAHRAFSREDHWELVLQGQPPVSVVVDNVAGDAVGHLLLLLARGGRYVSSGAIAGAEVSLDWRQLYLKDITLLGCTAWDAPVFPNLVGYVARNEIKPLLAGTFALSDIARAQAVFLERRHIGNLVLLP